MNNIKFLDIAVYSGFVSVAIKPKKLALLMFGFLCFLSLNSHAFDVGKKAVLKVYDGDSINIKTRMAHIDTPETDGACSKEIELAVQARNFTQKFMKAYPKYDIKVVDTGFYGRPLVEIRANGQYLNQLLVDRGLARVYEGRRKSWCL